MLGLSAVQHTRLKDPNTNKTKQKYKQYSSSIDGGPVCVPAHPPTPLGGVPVQVLRGSRGLLPTLQIQVKLHTVQNTNTSTQFNKTQTLSYLSNSGQFVSI